MSHKKKNNCASIEKKESISINARSNISGNEILRLLDERYVGFHGAYQEVPIGVTDLKRLIQLLENDSSNRANLFPKSKEIPALEIFGEPESYVIAPFIKDKKLLELKHVDNRYCLHIGGSKNTLQPPASFSHYLI